MVATDLDRTLIWEDGALRERTLAALRRADRAGLRVIVVTGRMMQSLWRVLEPAGVREPIICYQGGLVADADGALAAARPSRSSWRGRRSARGRPERTSERVRRRRAVRD